MGLTDGRIVVVFQQSMLKTFVDLWGFHCKTILQIFKQFVDFLDGLTGLYKLDFLVLQHCGLFGEFLGRVGFHGGIVDDLQLFGKQLRQVSYLRHCWGVDGGVNGEKCLDNVQKDFHTTCKYKTVICKPYYAGSLAYLSICPVSDAAATCKCCAATCTFLSSLPLLSPNWSWPITARGSESKSIDPLMYPWIRTWSLASEPNHASFSSYYTNFSLPIPSLSPSSTGIGPSGPHSEARL